MPQVVWVSVANPAIVYHLDKRCGLKRRSSGQPRTIPTTEDAAIAAGLRLCRNCSHLEDALRAIT